MHRRRRPLLNKDVISGTEEMPRADSAVQYDLGRRFGGTKGEPASLTLDVRVVDPTEDPSWDAFVATHPEGSVFHTAAWARVLKDSYGHEPIYLIFSLLGKPAALLPIMEVASRLTGRRGVALPFSDYCSPLLFEGVGLNSITKHVASLTRDQNWRYLEVRGGCEFSSDQGSTPTFYGHALRLSGDADELREGFSSSVRRNLRKAQRSGLTVQTTRTREAVSQFYKLHLRTRWRHGAPPQPFRFFDNIYRHLIEVGSGFVTLASRDGKAVAGAVYLTHGKNAVYKFGASDERYNQYRANNLVMWEAIKYLCKTGAKNLHFGRTSPDNDGLRRFKLGWGAQEEAIRYWRFTPGTGNWTSVAPDSSSLAQHVFRKLPPAVNRLAGALLYPHLD